MNWFEAARQEWIRDMLQVYGFVNRQHLRNKFGISQPQASKDLQKFLRANPDFVHYDLTRKAYVRTV
jgi:DeoR/GlpR family transcriptional regulator of sugar metabolism